MGEGFEGSLSGLPLQDLFQGPAGIAPDAQALLPRSVCRRDDRLRLGQGVASRKSDSVQISGLQDPADQVLDLNLFSPRRVPGLGIVAAGTVMGTALKKDREPHAGSVHTGMLYSSRDPGGPRLFFLLHFYFSCRKAFRRDSSRTCKNL